MAAVPSEEPYRVPWGARLRGSYLALRGERRWQNKAGWVGAGRDAGRFRVGWTRWAWRRCRGRLAGGQAGRWRPLLRLDRRTGLEAAAAAEALQVGIELRS